MKINKKRNRNGEPTFTMKIAFLISKSRLILALTDHYYRHKHDASTDLKDQLDLLTREEAIVTLYYELRLYGMQGEHPDGFFEAAAEIGEIRNETYDICAQWVCDKFPELNK